MQGYARQVLLSFDRKKRGALANYSGALLITSENMAAAEEVADYQEDELYEGDEMYDDVIEEGDGGGEPEEMKKQVQEMEQELDKLNKIQQQVERQISNTADAIDEKSIYVGQVDYEATPEELRAHFAPCGTINRVTIMCDKTTGHPKG